MSQRIPPCRFCGADLRRSLPRIVVRGGARGHRYAWGCCGRPECLAQLRVIHPDRYDEFGQIIPPQPQPMEREVSACPES